MAGDWIKIELELPDKPEVHAIGSDLGIDPDAVVGKLIRIWQWFDKHTVDGNARGVTFSLVDRITGVTGFGDAMSCHGWLVQEEKILRMPKFDSHTSKSAKERALTAKRVAKSKGKSNANGNDQGNGASVTNALPREEKRIEEYKEPPISPKGEKSRPISMKTFLEQCREKKEQPIPEDDSVFAFAKSSGIPHELIALCWKEFKHRMLENGNKRYRDWRKAFRNCARGNWYRLWYESEGEIIATSQAQILLKAHKGQQP